MSATKAHSTCRSVGHGVLLQRTHKSCCASQEPELLLAAIVVAFASLVKGGFASSRATLTGALPPASPALPTVAVCSPAVPLL